MQVKEIGLNVLKAISYLIDVEEGEKIFHSWRVAAMAKLLADEKCKENSLALYIAGLLHDVGTFDLSNRLAHHKDQMEDVDVAAVKVHPQKGAAIVASLPGFIPIAKYILDHHEYINGKGYPRGLRGNDISLGSQILRIADRFAFLMDIGMARDVNSVQKLLVWRIGEEFSKDLYDCLMDQLKKDGMWENIADNGKLQEFTKKLFSQMPTKEDEKSFIGYSLFSFFGRILDAKHSYTEGHSRRVSYFSTLIALALDLPDEEVEKIELAGYLHDIGKIGIPRSILDKKGKLTEQEFDVIKKHAALSYNMVSKIHIFERLSDIVGADQEHWDGSGYPKGLKMIEIPVGARIIFVADAFDALTSNRSYRRAVSVAEAVKELKRCAGTDFDPNVVDITASLLEGFDNSAMISTYVGT